MVVFYNSLMVYDTKFKLLIISKNKRITVSFSSVSKVNEWYKVISPSSMSI